MEAKLARRSGGRSRKSIRQTKKTIDQLDWSIPYNTDNFIEPLDADGIQAIDNAAMQVIEEIGIQFLNEEAKSILIDAGCKVDQNSSNVIMDRHWVKEMVAKAPTEFEIVPRNPEKSVKIGGRNMAFVNVSSPPNVMDLDRGRRVGDFESFKDLMKLTQYFNCIHLAGGYPVEPVDIHASIRHLDCLYEKLTLTDKVLSLIHISEPHET